LCPSRRGAIFLSMTIRAANSRQRGGVAHVGRMTSGAALLGAALAGTFFGWLPAAGPFGVHEVGAVIGAGVGAFASLRHLV
jgi:hypothetical protein